jgi:hypothetical protein
MSNKRSVARIVLFLVGCIGSRLGLAYLAWWVSLFHLKIMGLFALVPAIGFLTIYLTDSRQTGSEVFGDKIWWNSLRPIHSALWFLFALSALTGHRWAWMILLADVLIGLTAYCRFIAM